MRSARPRPRARGRAVRSALRQHARLALRRASPSLLLTFVAQDMGFGGAIGRELAITEVVATRVGSIGLVAAVALRTATPALLALRPPIALLPAHDHPHHH